MCLQIGTRVPASLRRGSPLQRAFRMRRIVHVGLHLRRTLVARQLKIFAASGGRGGSQILLALGANGQKTSDCLAGQKCIGFGDLLSGEKEER